MGRVVHFEIAADQPERAAKFYEEVCGWKIAKWDGPAEYWFAITGEDSTPGINGSLVRRNETARSTGVTVDVPSIEAFTQTVVEKGGGAVGGKHAVPGMGWYAYFRDTEGNLFGAWQTDPAAK